MSNEIEKAAPTGMVDWKEELKRQAQAAAAQEANVGGGGQFFSIRGGRLSWNKNPIPGGVMDVIVLDAVCENAYYIGAFNPDVFAAPVCFAFGRDDKEMVPHAKSESPQSPKCAGCPLNEWGSATIGQGKACKNRRRLAILNLPKSADTVESEQVGYLALPPTALKGWADYVNTLAAVHGLPPHAVISRVKVEPDDKVQVRVSFSLVAPLADEFMPAVMKRNKAVGALIEFPYTTKEESAPKTVAPAAKKARKY